ncbi:FG-GAP repeat domain-containing protein, partial [Singulisphaera rosea]
HPEPAQAFRQRIAEIDRNRASYKTLVNSETAQAHAGESATLARTLGRRFEADCWSMLEKNESPRPWNHPSPRQTLADLLPEASRGPSDPSVALTESPATSKNAIQFVDDADSAGLKFVHDNGQTPLKLLPETMSGGVALLDYDGDGWLDVYAVQGGHFPPDKQHSLACPGDKLFRNRHDGSFEDVSHASRIDQLARGYGHGVAVADFDNDGRPDLFLTRWDAYSLLRNRGDGAFDDVTGDAGLAGPRDWPTSAAWADLDNDGDLDLYVCHYLKFDPSQPHLCTQAESQENYYCSPRDFEPWPDHVFRNDRGHFVDVTHDWGFSEHEGRGLGVVAAHLDDDDKIDVYVANDMSANFLFRNLGNSHFEESALASGAASSADGGYKAGMGVGCGDLDGDGLIDLAVTNFYNESTTFYKNLGGGLFGDHTAAIGLAAPTRFLLGFGIALLDVDNDARLDLLSVNGHISNGQPAFPWKMPIQLLRGGPDGRLLDVSERAGDPFQPLHLGR